MKITIKKLFDTVRILLRVQREDISYEELIKFFYGEVPPPHHNFLRYDYSPYIERAEGFKSGKALPLFSVIIPTYNRSLLAENAINHILRQTDISPEGYEIIVVDNGSQDATEEALTKFSKETLSTPIIYVKLRANYGADFARNIAILHSRGRYVAFTDDDCIVPSDWLSEFKREFAADPDIVGVGGWKFPAQSGSKLDIFHRFLMWRHFLVPHIRSQKSDIYENRCGLTANVCYRRNLLEELGGFNIYFKHVGFYEFKIRAHKAGRTLLYEPRTVEHFARFAFKTNAVKLLAQGWDWYLLYKLHPDIRANPSSAYFLKRIGRDVRDILRSGSKTPLYAKSFFDAVCFLFLSVINNFFLWFGKYWIPIKMRSNPRFGSHDTLL